MVLNSLADLSSETREAEAVPMSLSRIKTITSHSGLARWLAEVDDTDTWLARVQVQEIPSPYASPSQAIYDWNGRKVVWFEVRHRRYEVFAVPPNMLRFKSVEAATDWHIRYSRKAS